MKERSSSTASSLPAHGRADCWSADDPLPLYKFLVEQVPDALIFADRDGVIRTWNRGAETLFGFDAKEAVGKSLDLIVPERFRNAHWRAYRLAVVSGRTRGGSLVRTTRAEHKLGHKLYVDLSFGLVTDPSGTVLGSVAMGRDCTARHEAGKLSRAPTDEATAAKATVNAADANTAIGREDEQAP
jgi:PAS domain S-box-containing protein